MTEQRQIFAGIEIDGEEVELIPFVAETFIVDSAVCIHPSEQVTFPFLKAGTARLIVYNERFEQLRRSVPIELEAGEMLVFECNGDIRAVPDIDTQEGMDLAMTYLSRARTNQSIRRVRAVTWFALVMVVLGAVAYHFPPRGLSTGEWFWFWFWLLVFWISSGRWGRLRRGLAEK